MNARIGFGLVMASLLVACTPPLEKVSLTLKTDPPVEVEVTNEKITIPEGIAIAVDVVGIDADGEDVEDLLVTTETVGTGEIAPVDNEGVTYVVSGDKVGSYDMVVRPTYGDGEVRVKVDVVAQGAE